MRPFAAVAFFLAACAAPAQVGRLFVTPDALVQNAAEAYVGSIERMQIEPVDVPYRRLRVRLEVRVTETLRGKKRDRIELDFVGSFTEQIYRDLATDRGPMLWLGGLEESGLKADLTSKMGWSGESPMPEMLWFTLYPPGTNHIADVDFRVFTGDLRVIATQADLLREARRAAKETSQIVPTVAFYPPRPVARMCGDPNAFAVVLLPRTPRTRNFLNRLANQPERTIAAAIRRSRNLYHRPQLTPEAVEQLREAAKRLLDAFAEN